MSEQLPTSEQWRIAYRNGGAKAMATLAYYNASKFVGWNHEEYTVNVIAAAIDAALAKEPGDG